MQTVEDTGDAVLVSLTTALQNFLGFLPLLLGAIVILVLGWILSGLLAGLLERLLRAIGFEHASQAAGVEGFIRKAGSEWTASRVIAEIVKWFIRLVAIQAAAAILGMGEITEIINEILLFLPRVVVALAIIVLGAFIARFVAGVVRGTVGEMGFDNPELIASIARYAIIVFAVIAAVNELGIAETVVNTLLIGTVGAVALAFGLAFGLGGQQTAAQLTQQWYSKGREASQRVAQYAEREGGASTAPRGAAGPPAGGAPPPTTPGTGTTEPRPRPRRTTG